jgi:hypothetical protein
VSKSIVMSDVSRRIWKSRLVGSRYLKAMAFRTLLVAVFN